MVAACCQSNGGIKVKETAIRLFSSAGNGRSFQGSLLCCACCDSRKWPWRTSFRAFYLFTSATTRKYRPITRKISSRKKKENTEEFVCKRSEENGPNIQRLITGNSLKAFREETWKERKQVTGPAKPGFRADKD